jgi:glycosyltransferase involved in cell wall biosynthesis
MNLKTTYNIIGFLVIILVLCLLAYYFTPKQRSKGRRILSQKELVPSNFDPSKYLTNEKEVTWIIHMYPPKHNAGAEWMAHAMNLYLIKEGYTVNIILPKFDLDNYQGVNIYTFNDPRCVDVIGRSKVLISHLDYSEKAVRTARVTDKPVILVMHNWLQKDHLLRYIKMYDKERIHLIHNSQWIKNLYNYLGFNSTVLYPPVSYNDYKTETTRKYVTLVNLNKNKGGDVLIEIAKAMPDVEFMGVIGAYDNQIINTSVGNIHYVKSTPQIKKLYGQTDILLVPSDKESWGRVAVEAMSSGIPVIANPTEGLKESMSYAGIFANRDDITAWVNAIRKLKTNETYYKKISQLCVKRSHELDPEAQLNVMKRWIEQIPN